VVHARIVPLPQSVDADAIVLGDERQRLRAIECGARFRVEPLEMHDDIGDAASRSRRDAIVRSRKNRMTAMNSTWCACRCGRRTSTCALNAASEPLTYAAAALPVQRQSSHQNACEEGA
jgi:hypothetical protein